MTTPEPSYREIPLSKGLFALVDSEDYQRISQHKWCASWRRKRNIYYAVRHERQGDKVVTILMHREVMGLPPGREPKVDHRNDRETLKNTKGNLRIATNAQNMCNRGIQKNNTSGRKGVCWNGRRWQVSIKHDGKQHYLGVFLSLDEASFAYEKKAKELHGEFARTA